LKQWLEGNPVRGGLGLTFSGVLNYFVFCSVCKSNVTPSTFAGGDSRFQIPQPPAIF